MADAYVYYFTTLDKSSGKSIRSKRMATLDAIKQRGDPVMETQTTVDPSELDADGFLAGRTVSGSEPGDEVWGEIRSLNLRAAARDREALEMDERTDGARKYLLSVESRELRKQARQLQRQCAASELNEAATDAAGVCPDPG